MKTARDPFTCSQALVVAIAFACLPAVHALDSAPGESGPSPEWISQVQAEIAGSEYEITWQDRTVLPDLAAAWHAANRSHGFRAYFTGEGIRLVPRSEERPTWEWGLSLSGSGRGGGGETSRTVRITASLNRVELDRGAVREWYVNSPRGIEHGFTIDGPPAGETTHDGPPVLVELDLTGTLSPFVSGDGQSIEFRTPDGIAVLRYSELSVVDARGRALGARMDAANEAGRRLIRIVVEDAEAAYPVTIDPIVTSPSWTVDGIQWSALLGISVGTAGDVNGDGYSDVIVGAYTYDNGQNNEGSAWVYAGSATGPRGTALWMGEGNQADSGFGRSVGTAGDVNGDGYSDILVGAPWYDNVQSNEGRAFVYHGSASGPAASAAWTAESNQADAYFGQAVGAAGDVNGDGYSEVIVGALQYDMTATDEGRAYVYQGSATGLAASPAWTYASGQMTAHLGVSVGTAGDVNGDGFSDVIVGADRYDNAATDGGRACVFHGSATGLSASPAWTKDGDGINGWLGGAVATAGDVNADGYSDIVVGAPNYTNGEGAEGRGYVYLGWSTGLRTTPVWTWEPNVGLASFGSSVATAGDVNGDGYGDVIVGSYRYSNGQSSEGRAYVFLGNTTGLSTVPVWMAESNQATAWYGYSVGTAGDVNGDGYSDIIVGASQYDNVQIDEGRAYVYLGGPSGLITSAGWSVEMNRGYSHFGWSVAGAGDVNGDRYGDVIVGAPFYDNGHDDEGAAFVYLGAASGPHTTPDWSAEGNRAGANYGDSVASGGDVNGDGYGDIVIGSPEWTNGQSREGRALVFHGSATGPGASPAWSVEGNEQASYLGRQVASAGDVNGDGYSDLIVGSPGSLSSGDTGRAMVYHGSAAGLSPDATWFRPGIRYAEAFGFSVAAAGDVNRDGFGDVIVGGPKCTITQSAEGCAYLFYGSTSGLAATPGWTYGSGQASADLGMSVASAGDVNGDGYSDLIVGAPSYSNGQTDEGRAYCFHGSSTGPGAAPNWTAEVNVANAAFGRPVASAGDTNADGYSDVVVGSPWYANPDLYEGAAWVYTGSATGLSSAPAWTIEGGAFNAMLGFSVAGAGDVNADGYSDLIVGAYGWSNGEAAEGAAHIYYGNGTPGRYIWPYQRHWNNTRPVAPLCSSDMLDAFVLAMVCRTPLGRGDVKLEWEVKPLATLLNGTGLDRSDAWISSGTNGAYPQESITGLVSNAQYHWRMRPIYRPSNVPFLPHGPWTTMVWNGPQEADIRTLATDHDGDGYTGASDCDDGNSTVWSLPGEATNLRFTSRSALAWTAPPYSGGTAGSLVFDLLRSQIASDFSNTVCIETNSGPDTTAVDTSLPAASAVFFYLVRADSACPGEGTLGVRSSGTPRMGRTCP